MTTAVFYIGDVHLGFRTGSVKTNEGVNRREQDVYDAFYLAVNWISTKWVHLQETREDVTHGIVLQVGDLFNRDRPSLRALDKAIKGFNILTEVGLECFVIGGNHDLPRSKRRFPPIKLLQRESLIHPVTKSMAFKVDSTNILAVPYQWEQSDFDRAIERASKFFSSQEEGMNNILMLHCGTSDMTFYEGETKITTNQLDTLQKSGMTYCFMGHYHNPHTVNGMASYCGSVERMTKSEADDEKNVGVCLFTDGNIERQDEKDVVRTDRRQMGVLSVDASGKDTREVYDSIVELARKQDDKEKIYYIEVEGISEASYKSISLKQLRGDLSHILPHSKVDFRSDEIDIASDGFSYSSGDVGKGDLSFVSFVKNSDKYTDEQKKILLELDDTL